MALSTAKLTEKIVEKVSALSAAPGGLAPMFG